MMGLSTGMHSNARAQLLGLSTIMPTIARYIHTIYIHTILYIHTIYIHTIYIHTIYIIHRLILRKKIDIGIQLFYLYKTTGYNTH